MGLLHDIGKILVVQIMEEIAEQETIEEDDAVNAVIQLHEDFGALLLARWNLPKELQRIARYHDRLDEAPEITQDLLIIHLANRLTRRIGHSLHPDDGTPLAKWPHIEELMLDDDIVNNILDQTVAHMKENSLLH